MSPDVFAVAGKHLVLQVAVNRKPKTAVSVLLDDQPLACETVDLCETTERQKLADAVEAQHRDEVLALALRASAHVLTLRAKPSSPSGDETQAVEKDRIAVEALNQVYFMANEHGRTTIWRPRHEFGRVVYDHLSAKDFLLLYGNQQVSGGKKKVPLGKLWLEHPDRKTFGDVVFNPAPGYTAPAGTLNLWQGFSVEPTKGSWERLEAHARQIICSGNDADYHYLLRFLARTVQHPDLRGEVAVVLRGGRGVGKGALLNTVAGLFGQHGWRVDQMELVTGTFSAHLRDCCVLLLDEAYWPGNKQHEGRVKGLITEPTMVIHPKYQTPFIVENRLSIFLSTNAEWVVPAARDERRFFVLDVLDTYQGNHAYFDALFHEIENGGLAAFLYHLLHLDLTGFDHRAVPRTAALQEQVLHTLEPAERWWHERLQDGEPLGEQMQYRQGEEEPPDTEDDVRGNWWVGTIEVRWGALHRDLLQWCQRHRVQAFRQGHDTKSMLGWALKRWLPKGWPRNTWRSGPRDEAYYELPLLEECRKAFSKNREGLFGPDRPVLETPQQMLDLEARGDWQ